MGLKDLRSGGKVVITKELILILIECFVLGVIILVLHVSLGLATGTEGLVKLDSLFKEAEYAKAGEYFPYAPVEYCPVLCR